MFFFKFILLLFVFALAVIVLIAYKFYKQLHRVVKRFNPDEADPMAGQQNASGRATRQADGNTIVDHRSEERRNKKIIKDNEGEYIDYQ